MSWIYTEKPLKISLAVGALWLLTSCGSSKSTSGGFEAGSNAPPGTEEQAMATCSADVANLGDFQVQVMQYGSGVTSSRPDLLRVKIVKAPDAFIDESWEVTMYRWTASTNGPVDLDSTPLSFWFERKDSSNNFLKIISDSSYKYPFFPGSQVDDMVTYANQFTAYPALSAASATTFFQGATFLVDLKDQTGSYKVLRVSLKSGSSEKRKVDILIPSFYADPAQYNNDPLYPHPAVLQNLHPLKSKLGQGWSPDQYTEFARSFCF